ncbi:MAG: arsenate reductase (azurin) small subunit [Devosia sp.]
MKGCNRLVDVGRRQFLRGGAVAAVGAASASVMPASAQTAQTAALVDYPSNRLANVADLEVNEPLTVAYPDSQSPGVLLKLGLAVPDGVGPDTDIVGFSILCPHKGWPLIYSKEQRTFNCRGHYSIFDPEKGGQQTWGQATQNLPQFVLRVDGSGNIFAEGVDELIYGRTSNVLGG